MMKVEKNKIVFAAVLAVIFIFLISYSVMVMGHDDSENESLQQTLVPDLEEDQKEYESKLDAINDLKEVRDLARFPELRWLDRFDIAVPALLAGLHSASDEFLQHALVYALVELQHPAATLAGLAVPNPRVQQGALAALMHRISTDAALKGQIEQADAESLDEPQRANLREIRRDWRAAGRGGGEG